MALHIARVFFAYIILELPNSLISFLLCIEVYTCVRVGNCALNKLAESFTNARTLNNLFFIKISSEEGILPAKYKLQYTFIHIMKRYLII